MPALRTKEQEIMAFVDIYIKASDDRKAVEKKLKASYTKAGDVKFGLRYFDEQMKRIHARESGKGKAIRKNFALIAVAAALMVFFTFAYLMLFENLYFKENSCSNESVSVELMGPALFREAMSERLKEVMERDCESFLLVAENVKGIEFREGINALFDESSGMILVGSYGNEDFWYTVVFVKGACMFNALKWNPDVNQAQMELDCLEEAAVAAERVHKNDVLAAYLRQKLPSRNWREFWLYGKQ